MIFGLSFSSWNILGKKCWSGQDAGNDNSSTIKKVLEIELIMELNLRTLLEVISKMDGLQSGSYTIWTVWNITVHFQSCWPTCPSFMIVLYSLYRLHLLLANWSFCKLKQSWVYKNIYSTLWSQTSRANWDNIISLSLLSLSKSRF